MTVSNIIEKKIKGNKTKDSKFENVLSYDDKTDDSLVTKYIGTDYSYGHEIVWKNAIGFLILHFFALWGLFIIFTGRISLITTIWAVFVMYFGSEGVTIGAHRYYTHKSFKAKPVLRAILVAAQTIAGQEKVDPWFEWFLRMSHHFDATCYLTIASNTYVWLLDNSLYIWCRDHRLHHRYSDTDADPHNSKRGFFFCHIGWLMTKKHPYVIELGRKIDLSDLQADWMVMFQKKYYYPLYLVLALFLPVWVPVQYFGELWWNSLLVCYFCRYVFSLNGTWLVNSAAHLYGTRPYDQNLQPVESWFVSMLSLGEGWHNYHHAFPWDYKAAELTMHFNQTASIIRFFVKMGLAYDLKTASPEMVGKRILRTGDGSHPKLGNEEARSAVTAWGPLHPLNPTYNTTLKPPDAILKPEGLPLYHEKDILKLDVKKEQPI